LNHIVKVLQMFCFLNKCSHTWVKYIPRILTTKPAHSQNSVLKIKVWQQPYFAVVCTYPI